MRFLTARISPALAAVCVLAGWVAAAAPAADPVKQPGMQAAYGIGIIPEPKSVRLATDEFRVNAQTAIAVEAAPADPRPVDSLRAGIEKTTGLRLATSASAGRDNRIVLRQVPASQLERIPAAGRSKECYTLDVTRQGVVIQAAHSQGLFYGVQSFVQLLALGHGAARAAAIADWPDMEFRAIHVDLWYHQDRPWYYERLFQQLSYYKMNAVVFEFEDKFQYTRHPVLAAPGAMPADEVKRLVRLAAQSYIEVVPLVQTLGHLTFVTKHPEFAPLQELPISTWQLCPLKPGSLALARDMLDEIMAATEGTRYIHIGGDETWELGRGKECQQKWGPRAALESYKLWLTTVCDYVRSKGRVPIVWDDIVLRYLKDAPLEDLPANLIYMRWNYDDGRLPESETALLKRGLPVWIATSAQTMTPIFPDQRLRVYNSANLTQFAAELGVKGSLNTAWEDAGIHPETYWIGFLASAEYSWTGNKPTLEEFRTNFFRLFYGASERRLAQAYDILSEKGFLRDESAWSMPFRVLKMPPLPDTGFRTTTAWRDKFGALAAKARQMRPRYQEAVDILTDNLARDVENRYNLEVLLLCAKLQRHFTDVILRLNDVDDNLLAAQADHEKGDDAAALNRYHRSLRILEDLRYEKSLLYEETVKTWEKSTFPKDFRHIPGGRERYVYQVDRDLYYGNKSMDLTYIFEVEERLGIYGFEQQLAETVKAILPQQE